MKAPVRRQFASSKQTIEKAARALADKKRHAVCVLVSPIADSLPEMEADWIGVDGGGDVLASQNRQPLALLGDFDSAAADIFSLKPEWKGLVDVVSLQPEKDETDGQLAMDLAVKAGYETIVFWGSLQGRLDHTLANLRLIAWQFPQVVLMDEKCRVQALLPGEYHFEPYSRHISFFACEPSILTLEGFAYPLYKQPINEKDIFTCSNALDQPGMVVVGKGRVLCVETDFQ